MAEIIYKDDWLLVVNKPHGADSQHLYAKLRDREPTLALLHRLDQPASGLLLMTRRPEVNPIIAADFREHRIERRYCAVLMGAVQAGACWQADIDGKRAKTTVVEASSRNGMTAALVAIETGRTHQIRKHAEMAGAAVAGDRRYGGDAGMAWPRLCLHAHSLRFDHPITAETVSLTAPIPDDMSQMWGLAGG